MSYWNFHLRGVIERLNDAYPKAEERKRRIVRVNAQTRSWDPAKFRCSIRTWINIKKKRSSATIKCQLIISSLREDTRLRKGNRGTNQDLDWFKI